MLGRLDAQYNPVFMNPTARLLDQEFNTGAEDLQLTAGLGQKLNLKFNFVAGYHFMNGQTLPLSTESATSTGQEILDMIDAADDYKVLVREWEVLVVSDVSEDRIKELGEIARDLKHKDHESAVDQLLNWAHPAIYPSLFWVMKNDTPDMAKKVAHRLLVEHAVLMNYSPSFENAAEGFERSFQDKDQELLRWAYNLPTPILKDVDPQEWFGKYRSNYLDQQVALAKMTFADLKREYAEAPDSPAYSELCGTGYVHVYNHNDYANVIGDLRTEEAYDFLNAQANLLAKEPTAKNQKRLAEIAIALSKRETDDALNIANIIIKQQGLDKPATIITRPAGFFPINATVNMLKVLATTRQSKYDPVFQAFSNSDNFDVRQAALRILQQRNTPDLFQIAIRGIGSLEKQSATAKSDEEKAAVEQSRYLAGSVLAMFETDEAQQYFLKLLDQPDHQMEAAGYLASHFSDQSVATLRKILSLEVISPLSQINLRVELLNRNDQATIADMLKLMEEHCIELVNRFKKTDPNGLDFKMYAGWPYTIGQDFGIMRSNPKSVSRGLELMDAGNATEQRVAGAILIYSAYRNLITDEVAESLMGFKDDPELLVNRAVNAILDARK